MQDLGSISKALQEAIASDTETHSLSEILNGYLSSSRYDTRELALEAFLEILIDSDGTEDESKCKSVLGDTALEYLPVLLPLLSSHRQPVSLIANLINKYGKPREVVLGLNEALQNIQERSQGFVVSDDEDGEVFDDDEGDDGGLDWESLALETIFILSSYALVLPRLPNLRSTPTLLSLDDAISSTLPVLTHHMTSDWSRQILRASCEMIISAWRWTSTTSDAGGEQKAILSRMLFMAVTLFGSRVNANLTSRWFTGTFPRFANFKPDQEDADQSWKEGQDTLSQAVETAKTLDLTPATLLDKLIHPSSSSPYSALASLILLACSLLDPKQTEVLLNDLRLARSILSDSMPVLSAALGSSSMDAGAAWTWYLVHEASKGKVEVEYDAATLLLELLVPLTSIQPSPTTRLALFKLLGAVIQSTSPRLNQILLFQQLLEPSNPFDQIRVRSLSLLREQISHAASMKENSQSGILCRDLLTHLEPILLELPSELADMDLKGFKEGTGGNWLTDVANLLWVLYDVDVDNRTGIRDLDTVERIKAGWMKGVGDLVGRLRVELGGGSGVDVAQGGNLVDGHDGQVSFMLERLGDALTRLKQVLGSS